MRYRLATAALCLLTSCAAPASPAQTAFALEAGYDAAANIAIAYAVLPRCGPATAKLCSDPMVVKKTNDIAHQAWIAIRAAEAATRPHAQAAPPDPATIARALTDAQAALAALRAITDHLKVS